MMFACFLMFLLYADCDVVQRNKMYLAVDVEAKGKHTDDVVHFSAMRGLPNFRVEHMRALCRELHVKEKSAPTSEKAWLSAILRHLFEAITQEMINDICGLRKMRLLQQKEEAAKQNLVENFALLDGVLDDDDMKEMADIITKAREKVDEKYAGAQRQSLAGVVTADRGSKIDLEWARSLKPCGSLLSKDTKLFWRWQGSMPKKVDKPRHYSKCWGSPEEESLTEAQALKDVFEKLWEGYREARPEEDRTCPHDLASLLAAWE